VTIKNILIEHCDMDRIKMLKSEIGKVRCWLTGYAAAGGELPPGTDSLRMVQILLDDAKEINPHVEDTGRRGKRGAQKAS
jgi:hypothetical protein